MGRLAGPVAAAVGQPSIGHIRDIIRLSEQTISDLNCNRRLLAVSRAAREYHIAQGVDAARTYVVYNGVDVTRFALRPPTGWLRAELGLPEGAQLIGAVGQLVLRKGHDVLAAAAALLAPAHPNAHYVFVGSRFSEKAEAYAHEASLHQAFSTGPLARHGHFLGFRSNVAELLPELTILAHPARQEPLGRVLLEAAAAGVAVVATDVGGTREIFPDGAAQIVPAGDAAALAGAIDALLVDETLRRRQAEAAATHVRSEFSAARAAEALAAHYKAVLDE
jgi:glycosyltransferase involved in cell wall biosynthesis